MGSLPLNVWKMKPWNLRKASQEGTGARTSWSGSEVIEAAKKVKCDPFSSTTRTSAFYYARLALPRFWCCFLACNTWEMEYSCFKNVENEKLFIREKFSVSERAVSLHHWWFGCAHMKPPSLLFSGEFLPSRCTRVRVSSRIFAEFALKLVI